jgi:DNA polymerase-3 subunit gamma/tau
MSFVRLCTPEASETNTALAARVEALERELRKLSRMLEQGEFRAVPFAHQTEESIPVGAKKPERSAEKPGGKPALPAETEAKPQTQPEKEPEPMDGKLWDQIIATLGKSNPALQAALAGSRAYTNGDLLLVDSPDELFLQLVRTSDYAKESLREAILSETGRRYRLGPFKRKKKEESPAGPFDAIEAAARSAGVEIEIKN